jgi:quercetin dioxygenase-like cupin family protein
MGFEFLHDIGDSKPIQVPEIGLELQVRLSKEAGGGELTIIETVNAPGFGPPLHRHPETEVFRVTRGRYLFEVDGKRFYATEGDVVCVPGGGAHGFVNVTDAPAKQIVMILPGFDAANFFTGLADVLLGGRPDPAVLAAFGKRWGVEFLGPPIQPDQ